MKGKKIALYAALVLVSGSLSYGYATRFTFMRKPKENEIEIESEIEDVKETVLETVATK